MDRRIDLGRARRDAKVLLRAARAGDPEALGRLRGDRALRLADAQHAVARELGAPSWPALVRRVEAQVEAGAAELLEAVFAGEHHAALSFASERPDVVARLRRDDSGALIEAARQNRADAVYTLLELGVPANVRDAASGGTVLHVAARMGWPDVVDVLVGWVPLDLQARDAAGATALGACVQGSAQAPRDDGAEHLVVAKVLVANGLRPEAGMVERASEALVGWLRESGATPVRPAELGIELGERAWSAEVALLTYLSGSPLAKVRRAGDGFALLTGLRDNKRNGVVCSRLPAETADERIAELLAWLDEHGAPALWMVAADTEPPDLRDRLERAGCQPERSAVYMAAHLTGRDVTDTQLPAGTEITAIRDAGQLAKAFAATDEPAGDPEQRERELALLAALGLGERRPLQHYAARRHGRLVGLASAFAASRTLMLTELRVTPAERRMGIGRALLVHVLRSGQAAGCTVSVLAPTPATVPFYGPLGFALGRVPAARILYTPRQ